MTDRIAYVTSATSKAELEKRRDAYLEQLGNRIAAKRAELWRLEALRDEMEAVEFVDQPTREAS